jgi:spermidine/putrescine transport system substrate-binding protein
VFSVVWFNLVDRVVIAIGNEEEKMSFIVNNVGWANERSDVPTKKMFKKWWARSALPTLQVILFSLIFFVFPVRADQVLNVYNWSSYMPDDVIQQFEKETGININYSTYDSNETMYAKLKADPSAAYDIVVPSSYFIQRMSREGMLRTIDKTRLPNFKNLNAEFLNKIFDPHNQYSIPYLWSSTGIVVNTKYFAKNGIKSWSDLWKPEYKDQLLLLDDTREVFSIALMVLGYSANDTNPDHIKQAYEKLKQLLPNVKLFNDIAVQNIYIDEDASIGMGWSGDIFLANQENSAVQYIYPKEGFVIALDNLAIPQGAKHLDNAYKFINFLLRPDIAARISQQIGYGTPNEAALKLLPKDIRNDPIVYPDKKTMERAQFQTDVGDTVSIYEKYLELLKMGG